MIRRKICILLALFWLLPLISQPNQFRGSERNGIYPDTGLLDKWPQSGPEMVGSISGLGDGFSAPSITEKGVFIAGMFDSTGIIQHFDHQQHLMWSYRYGKEFTFKYTGARGTPTLEGNRLYYSGTFGDAFCLNIVDGSLIWGKNIFETFGGKEIKWGYTESPLIYKDLVILTPGGPSQNVVALDKFNGELKWSVDLDSATNAYNSPFLINHNGEDYFTLNTTEYLLLIRPGSGEVAYKHPIAHPQNMHAISPIYKDGRIFNTTGYGMGAVLYKLNEPENRLDTVYYNADLDCRLSGLIMVDGIVYGTSDKKKQWVGVDFETGKTLFNSRELKPGSFLLADHKFYIFTETGEVALAEPNKEGFTVKSVFKIPVQPVQYAFTHPVMYRGILYIRYRDQLWLYNVSKSK